MAHFVRTHADGIWQGLSPPTITSVAPSSGVSAGLQSVVITGTGFSTATAVSFGARAADSFVVNSSTQITASTPIGGSPGVVDVTVTTSFLGSVTAPSAYTFT